MTAATIPTDQIACLECDLLLSLEGFGEGQRLACPRCGNSVATHGEDWKTKVLAWSLASVVLLVVANLFPFLSLYAGGLDNVMTLGSTAHELIHEGYWTIAVLVLVPIVGIPSLMLGILLSIVIPLKRGWRVSWLVPAARVLFFLSPWSMVEVFVIGVLVSLVKIGAMAKVVMGVSFFSYVAFALCFTAALSNLDRVQIWREIQAATS